MEFDHTAVPEMVNIIGGIILILGVFFIKWKGGTAFATFQILSGAVAAFYISQYMVVDQLTDFFAFATMLILFASILYLLYIRYRFTIPLKFIRWFQVSYGIVAVMVGFYSTFNCSV